jgi:hypothetical protein
MARRKTYNEILLEEAGLAHHFDPAPTARPAAATTPTSIVAEPRVKRLEQSRAEARGDADGAPGILGVGRRKTVILRYQGTELVVGPPDPASR